MLCVDLDGWPGGGEGGTPGRGDIYIIMVDSHCCMAETNTAL